MAVLKEKEQCKRKKGSYKEWEEGGENQLIFHCTTFFEYGIGRKISNS